MQNISQKITGAEHLTEVIAYLKNADKFVRQGEVNRALDEIVRAREKNPTIMYARAYEEYVRSILQKQLELSGNISAADSKESVIGQMLPTLEKILDLAIKEVKRSALSAYKQKEVFALQKKHEEDQRKEEQVRSAGLGQKIADYVKRAGDFAVKGDFHNALNEIARAFVLNPTDERILEMEAEIKSLQERHNGTTESENDKKQSEENKRREQLAEEWRQHRIQEKEAEEKKKEESYRQARSQKIREYLQVARGLLADQKLDEVFSQISFLMVLDPLNEEVLNLNWNIREAQAKKGNEKIAERKQREEEEEKKKAETIRLAVDNNLAKAEEYLSRKKFSEALRVITQAYFIDPANERVMECERKIMAAEEDLLNREEEQRRRAEEERRRKQEAEFHRLSIEQQKREQARQRIEIESKMLRDEEEAFLFLSKARGYFNQENFADALEHIAKAFKINPFDEEISKLQREILEAQKKAKRSHSTPFHTPPEPEHAGDEQTLALVNKHIDQAKHMRTLFRYQEALDEIARAYRYDPTNEMLFALEGEIQQEFLRHEEEQHRQQETSQKNQGIKKSLAMAREAFSREAYTEALSWVDYALSFDMRHSDIIQLKEEIERAQHIREEQKVNEDKEVAIQLHLGKAMEFVSENRPFEAIFEIDLALRLNPTHTRALALRKQLNEKG